ncbi:MAG: DUF885 domain-containing protein [Acidimicrobiia bacterium]
MATDDPTVREIADRYVERYAALDPIGATFAGLTGHHAEMTDYGPDAADERADHDRAVLEDLGRAPAGDDRDRVAAEVMVEQLSLGLRLHDAGEHLRELNNIASPLQAIRQVFDLMPTGTESEWDTVVARMALVPSALDSYRTALTAGAEGGLVAARRQVVTCAKQAETWGGLTGETPFFLALVDAYHASEVGNAALGRTLADRAGRATEAYAAIARFLVDEYSPRATERDAVGAERYAMRARAFTGMQLDLAETYAWGWDELHRINHAMGEVAERILPGESVDAAIEYLDTAPARAIEGEAALRAWLQDLMDRTVVELDGTHFDIPEPVKEVEAMIAPPGGAAAMYYTPPAEDFSRPGRTWYPTLGKTRFPLWKEVSICYHEGVPGHHLQVAQVLYLADELTRFQRALAWSSGHGEGWALYAERLMGELGYLDDAGDELGMLAAQAMRAMRVVVDIGLHLELPIPDGEPYHGGETWTPELALPFAIENSKMPADFMASEVDRYLGWPGQAISYKVGERVWLRARDDARRRLGDRFDLKAFHRYALDLGNMGLAQLEREIARWEP